MFPIVESREIAKNVLLQRILAPRIARKRKAGQFLVIRRGELSERIPLTIVDSDPVEGTVTIIFQAVGKSTAEVAGLKAGDNLLDVVGPLGLPTHVEKLGTIVGIGGGIGAAPLLPIATAFKKAGNRLVSIVGARTKDLLILEDEMRAISDEITVTTDDGSYARKGFVTTALQDLIDAGTKIDLCIAIGPVPMMRAVAEVTRPHGIKTVVSLNPIMVDATGMCGACRVSVGGKTKFVCVDGPEFDGHEVDFKELVMRNRAYLKEEKEAMDKFLHKDGKCMGSAASNPAKAGTASNAVVTTGGGN
ncbi:MAG TPA: sulfide/dihydroorotate dehydrogenase-like FAD/NAD-binding protein [Candidatus Deferrimicrobiaceae bacterium]|nr:sulfide/dihydroorotate dehydrogenase-like FAD/NAD-binding protein [Candidatus Deferrimicrobiaceae bacterium]